MTAIFFAVDENDIAFLKDQWDALSSFYSSDQTIKDGSFRILNEAYSERSRFYHNLSHIKLLLNLYESLKDQIQERNAIKFSIWFHDVVYDPRRNDNEEESARLASEVLGRLKVNAETTKFVEEWILATKSHNGRNLSGDAKLFLDMDLAILGMSKETYEKYRKAIRAEYSWVPELAYRRDRRKILKSFKDRETIYFTEVMQKRFEEQARKNIHGEIQSLEIP